MSIFSSKYFVICTLSCLSACSAVKVKPVDINGDTQSVVQGMPFYLSKTVLDITYSDEEVSAIAAKAVPDYKAAFIINPENFSNLFTESQFSITPTKSGTLASIGISLTDKSMDIITSLAKVALSVSSGIPSTSSALKGEVSPTTEVRIDPATLEYAYNEKSGAYENAEPLLLGEKWKVKIVSPIDMAKVVRVNNASSINGVPYRLPIPVDIQICKSECNEENIIKITHVNFLRMDILPVATIKSGILSGSATRKLSFDPDHGTLSEFSSAKTEGLTSDTSSGAASALSNITDLFLKYKLEQERLEKENQTASKKVETVTDDNDETSNCPEYLHEAGAC